jgi:hypothetical protein
VALGVSETVILGLKREGVLEDNLDVFSEFFSLFSIHFQNVVAKNRNFPA